MDVRCSRCVGVRCVDVRCMDVRVCGFGGVCTYSGLRNHERVAFNVFLLLLDVL